MNTRATSVNSRLPQVTVTNKIKSLCFYSNSTLVDSFVFLNRHLRQASNRMTLILALILTITVFSLKGQNNSCRIDLGTNITSIYDYGTEVCLVDLMKFSREWYTKGVNDPNWTFDTEMAQYLSYDINGYPTHIPQTIAQHPLPQYVCTIWAITDGWSPGTYTLLWDGNGTFSYNGPISNWMQTGPNSITFNFSNPVGGMLQLCITTSDINNPVRNMRLIAPGHINTYQNQPFNTKWLDLVKNFKVVRFMDWGRTNNFGQINPYTPIPAGDTLSWNERSNPDFYTYTHSKGVPYELMVKLMNDHDLDGWICVPHWASNHYIQKMAEFFRDNLEPERHLYVEFSNEIWNWIFGQTNWLYQTYNCDIGNNYWPECLKNPIENCMNIWTSVYAGNLNRITRVLGMFTGWFDVSKRLANAVNNNLYDAISPAYYFGISHETDSIMDVLGNSAGLPFFVNRVRNDRALNEWVWIKNIIDSIALPLNKKVCFYEGGQHITPIPFGAPSNYDQILLAIQRDTAMYNLYTENYRYIESLNNTSSKWLAMNFSLIYPLSAQYGSWGLLESLYQDTSIIPAPKLNSTLDYINGCNQPNSVNNRNQIQNSDLLVTPNPSGNQIKILNLKTNNNTNWIIYDPTGRAVLNGNLNTTNNNSSIINLNGLNKGIYILKVNEQYIRFVKGD